MSILKIKFVGFLLGLASLFVLVQILNYELQTSSNPLPTSITRQCAFHMVPADANQDGKFTYTDLLDGSVKIVQNVARYVHYKLEGTAIGDFFEIQKSECRSAKSWIAAAILIGILISLIILLPIKLLRIINSFSRTLANGTEPTTLIHFVKPLDLNRIQRYALSLSLFVAGGAILISSITKFPVSSSTQGLPQDPTKKVEVKKLENKVTPSTQVEKLNLQKQKEEAANAVSEHAHTQKASEQERNGRDSAEASARAEALKAAQEYQERLAAEERRRETVRAQQEGERRQAVRRQFEARCKLEYTNALETSKQRYKAECDNTYANAQNNAINRLGVIVCITSINEKSETYANTVREACMSGAPQ